MYVQVIWNIYQEMYTQIKYISCANIYGIHKEADLKNIWFDFDCCIWNIDAKDMQSTWFEYIWSCIWNVYMQADMKSIWFEHFGFGIWKINGNRNEIHTVGIFLVLQVKYICKET